MLATSSIASLAATSLGAIHAHAPATIVARRYGDYADDEYYDDRPRARPRASQSQNSFLSWLQNQKQIGATLIGIGALLTFMGMMLLFERNLLRLGNICIISGIPLLLGPNNVRSFFMQKSRMQAGIITAFGILLVFWGKPRFGIILEIFGLLNLFGNMFPLLYAMAKSTPGLGDVIKQFDKPKQGRYKPRYEPEF
jgi:hypothetical protein